MTRRHYANTAAPTTLSGGIGAGDVTFPVGSLTGYPASFPYLAVIDRTTNPTSAELVLVTAATGSTPTVTRAQGGTSAATHNAGASFEHVSAAIDFDEANAHVNATSGVHGLAGSVVGTTDTQTLTGKTLTAPTITSPTITGTTTIGAGATLTSPTLTSPTVTGASLDAASTIGSVSGTTIAADHAAWTTYTPTIAMVSSPTGTFAYKQIGKTLILEWYITGGTVAGTGVVTMSLPGGLATAAGRSQTSIQMVGAGTIFSPDMMIVTAGATAIPIGTLNVGVTLNGQKSGGTIVLEVA